jgi:hypothetical protein
MEIIKTDHHLETCVREEKKTNNNNKGLLLHYQSHVDNRYKRSLLKNMHDAKRLSSTPDFFSQECNNLKGIFLKPKYPGTLIDSSINSLQSPPDLGRTPSDTPLRITLPYKDGTNGHF